MLSVLFYTLPSHLSNTVWVVSEARGAAVGSQWERIDLPVLERVGDLEGDRGTPVKNVDELAKALGDGWDEAVVLASVGRLVRSGHLDAIDASSHSGDDWLRLRLSERGRRAAGLWPSNELADTLLAILDDRIADADDEEERSRWRQLRDSAGAVGQNVLGGILVEAAKRGMAL